MPTGNLDSEHDPPERARETTLGPSCLNKTLISLYLSPDTFPSVSHYRHAAALKILAKQHSNTDFLWAAASLTHSDSELPGIWTGTPKWIKVMAGTTLSRLQMEVPTQATVR